MVAALQLGWELLKPKMKRRIVIISLKILFTFCIKEGGGMCLMKHDLQMHHNIFHGFSVVCRIAFMQNV